MTTTHSHTPTLVLGGTGKTGRRVVERLTARGLPVRVGSRSGTPPFDWEDRATWAPALDGAWARSTLLLPRPGGPGRGRRGRRVRRARRRERRPAAGAAVRPRRARGRAGRAGRARLRRRPDDRALRPGSRRTSARTTCSSTCSAARSRCPAGDTPEPFVDADDIADVAVAALTDERHVGELYELTGPRLLTFAEAVAEISAAAGREIATCRSRSTSTRPRAGQGVPAEFVELLSYLFGEVLDGRNAHLADGVQRALGRAAARLRRLRPRAPPRPASGTSNRTWRSDMAYTDRRSRTLQAASGSPSAHRDETAGELVADRPRPPRGATRPRAAPRPPAAGGALRGRRRHDAFPARTDEGRRRPRRVGRRRRRRAARLRQRRRDDALVRVEIRPALRWSGCSRPPSRSRSRGARCAAASPSRSTSPSSSASSTTRSARRSHLAGCSASRSRRWPGSPGAGAPSGEAPTFRRTRTAIVGSAYSPPGDSRLGPGEAR